MIYSLRGIIRSLEPLYLELDVNGVGYGMQIPMTSFEEFKKASRSGKGEILVHTRLLFKEDNVRLYGFSSKEQALVFDFLRDLHGIGPQAAINLLSTLESVSLLEALVAGNSQLLTRTPGIGKTKAEKIIFEAKQKEKKIQQILNKMGLEQKVDGDSQPSRSTDEYRETLENALAQLGFQKKEIDKAFLALEKQNMAVDEETRSLEEMIRLLLKVI